MGKDKLELEVIFKDNKLNELKKEFNKMVKLHGEMKKHVSETAMQFAALKYMKAIEEKSKNTPDTKYVNNLIHTIEKNMEELRNCYGV